MGRGRMAGVEWRAWRWKWVLTVARSMLNEGLGNATGSFYYFPDCGVLFADFGALWPWIL
jgi:hypothetical protein